MKKLISSRWFNLISWGITILLVLAAVGLAYWRVQAAQMSAPVQLAATAIPTQSASNQPGDSLSLLSLPAIGRDLKLKTVVPARPRYDIAQHTVARGDSVFAIAKAFSIKPDSLLWANYDLLNGSPDSLRPGQDLNIPPTDGILYT